MKVLFRRLHYLLNRRRLDRELAADLEVHRELAALHGNIPLGSALHWREESRDAWGWTWIDRFFQDLRYAARMLRKSPGFTLMAVLMLAIGTGVNIAAFGFFDFMVLRPLNVRQPASLLRFHRRAAENYSFVLPYPEMAFYRDYSRSLSAVLALNQAGLTLEGAGKLKTQFVTANWFTELGAPAGLGRMLDPVSDEQPGAPPVVVLSHVFWQRHFAADPSVLGSIIRLNGKPATIVGVSSPAFNGLSLEVPDLWAPILQQPYFAAGSTLLTDFSESSSGVEMWGRLRPGLNPQAAQDELQSLAAELWRSHPKEMWPKETLPSEPSGYAQSLLMQGRRGTGAEQRDNIYPAVALIGTLTLLILAVACGNLGSLLLARGVARDREIAIRVAVGAGRLRLVRQLLTESLLLALLGSLAGLAAGYVLLRGLMLATGSPPWLDPTPDWRILAFAFGIACTAAVLFGFTPALQIARRRHRAATLRQLLIAVQVAASCILLISAALLVRALDHATQGDLGFDYRSVISVDPMLASHGYSPAASQAWIHTFQQRARALPGVAGVSFTDLPPFGNKTMTIGLNIDGRSAEALISRVDPEYFHTMRIPFLAGRNLLPGEEHAMVVSRSLARRLWPLETPLGKHIGSGSEAVVGVVGEARVAKLEDPDVAQIYYPANTADLPGSALVLRTAGPPEALLPVIASIARSIDPQVLPAVEPLQRALIRKTDVVQYGALAASALGLAALGLACLGIIGVVSYTVSQRSKEIGIRMALGARSADVVSAILRQFTLPVTLGLLAGIGGAAALSGFLRKVLYGISGLDPAAYLAAIAVFLITIAVAAWLPARRALRLDPMKSLRCD